ncbi:hypothetical protein, partial [Kineosporia babensis]
APTGEQVTIEAPQAAEQPRNTTELAEQGTAVPQDIPTDAVRSSVTTGPAEGNAFSNTTD